MNEIELILKPFITLAIILAMGGALWAAVRLIQWLIEVIPQALQNRQERNQRLSHPYRMEIGRVEAALHQIQLEEETEETRQALRQGEELLRVLQTRDRKGLAALKAVNAETVFSEVIGAIEAEDEVAYVRRRN